MRGKKIPTAQRAKAMGIALIDGAQAASEATGIPRPTIVGWTKRPEYDELRQKTRDGVADMLWAAVQIGVDQVAMGLLADAPLRDKAIALGVLYDKHALLTGEATMRTEHVDAAPANPNLAAARDAYLRALSDRPVAMGTGAVKGAAPNGHAAVRAPALPGGFADGYQPTAPDSEGAPNGDQPDRSD